MGNDSRLRDLALFSLLGGAVSGLISPSLLTLQSFLSGFATATAASTLMSLLHALGKIWQCRAARELKSERWLRRVFLLAPSLWFLGLLLLRGGLGVWWSVPLAAFSGAICCWIGLRWESRLPAFDARVGVILVVVLFFWMHSRTGTLREIKPGTELVHLGFSAVSSVGMTCLVLFAGGFLPKSSWAVPRLVSPLLVLLGVLLLRLDAAFLVGNYPAVHIVLWLLGLMSFMSGLIVWPSTSAGRPWMQGAGLMVLSLLGSFLLLFSQSTSLAARQGMAESSAGRLVLAIFPYSFSRQFAAKTVPEKTTAQELGEFSGLRGRYNILLITLDGMRADHLTPEVTPQLSQLADQAARFEYSYAQGSKTLIGLTALLTGRYSAHTPWKRVVAPGRQRPRWYPDLEPGVLLQERLGAQGYLTLACLEGGGDELFRRDSQFARGFGSFADCDERAERDGQANSDHQADSDHGVASDVSHQAALRAIEQRRQVGKKRYFQWIHLMNPHRSFEPKRYATLVQQADAAIGEVIQALREDNAFENTVIVVTADHGRSLGRRGMYGHATALSEEQIRVPLIFSLPGLPPARVPDVVGGIDVTRTLLFLGGEQESLAKTKSDGLNLLPTLVGDVLPERLLFSELHNDASSDPAVPRQLQAAIRFPYKLVLDAPRGIAATYNIVGDRFEERPLTGQLTEKMTQETLQFFGETTHARSRFGSAQTAQE